MINCGLIGVGKFGKHILRNLNRHKAIKNIYLCDTTPNNIENVQKLSITTNYKSLLENPDINSIFIATPSNTHYNILIDAIRADKHVFCEKPLCSTNKELLDVYETNKKYNKIIYCDYTFCYSNLLMELKHIIQIYNFRKDCCINISWKNTDFDKVNIETYIDVVRDLAVHCLSILMFLYDSNDISITHVDKIYDNHTIIAAKIYATILDNDCIINVSWDNYHKERIIHISNDNNELSFDFNKQTIVMSNKSVKKLVLFEKEEPLFNSISCFINSIEQPKNGFYIEHMRTNMQIMYIIQQILNNSFLTR